MVGRKPAARSALSAVGTTAFALVLAALVACQGGYFGAATCACGCAAGIVVVGLAVARMVSLRGRVALPPSGSALAVAGLLLLLAVIYGVSAFVHGLSFASLIETASWFAVAGIALLCVQLDDRAGRVAMAEVCWIGIACGAIGLLVASGVLPLPGAMLDERLQFTFQYANAAGIFFSCLAMLCLVAGDAVVRRFACLPLAAAFLTQSAGSLVVLVCALAVSAVWFARRRDIDRLDDLGAQAVVAVAAAVCCLAIDVDVVPAIACFTLAAYGWAAGREGFLVPPARVTLPVLAAVLAFVGAYFTISGRAFEASQTFIERFIQIYDAVGVVAASPLLGIGPDVWRWAFPYIQSAQYTASVVHCGYAQVAVDTGVIGLVVVLVVLAVGFVRLARRRAWGSVVVAGMLALHSLVDFDLQFSALAALLAFLLIVPCDEGEGGSSSESMSNGSPTALVCGVLGLAVIVVCSFGIAIDRDRAEATAFSTEPSASALTSDNDIAQMVIAAFEESDLARRDVDAQSLYLAALFAQSRYQDIVAYTGRCGVGSDDQALVLAYAYEALGYTDRAANALVAELEREPFNLYLFQEVALFFEEHGVPESCISRYRAAVDEANRRAHEWPASLLANQENVDVAPMD